MPFNYTLDNHNNCSNIKSVNNRHRRADERGHQSSLKTEGNKASDRESATDKQRAPGTPQGQPAPFAERAGRAEATAQGVLNQGPQINGRGFGRRRALFAAGPRLRREDVQNYPMVGDPSQKISRRKGLRSGDAGSDRTREVDSQTFRSKAAMSNQATLQKPKPPH